jgi:hypothetical protein
MYMCSTRAENIKDARDAQSMPQSIILTYEKTVGSSGKIYDLDIKNDGSYVITMTGGTRTLPIRAGRLSANEANAVAHLIVKPPSPCLHPPTIADSMINRIIYRNGAASKSIELGVLDQYRLSPESFNYIVILDNILNVVA